MYIFYNPINKKIMGSSDHKKAMDFPSIKTKEEYHSLENLYIDDKGEIQSKELTLKDDVSIIKRRGAVYDNILKKLDNGEMDDKMALRTLLKQLKKLT